jgi:hypothetical protein
MEYMKMYHPLLQPQCILWRTGIPRSREDGWCMDEVNNPEHVILQEFSLVTRTSITKP